MKFSKQKVIIFSTALLFGVGFWLADSIINYYYFSEHLRFLLFEIPQTFLDSLIINLSNYSIFIRVTFLIFCLIAGLIASSYMERLKKAEADLNLQTVALETTVAGVLIADVRGTILWCNPALAELTGYKKEEIIGQYIGLFKSDAHTAEFHKNLWETIRSGKVWHGEDISRHKDGTTYFEEQTITPILNTAGEITHYVSVRQDISLRKQTEIELLESEEHYRMVVTSTNEAIILQDKSGQILTWNAAAERLFGLSAQEVVGQPSTSREWKTYREDGSLLPGAEHPSMHTLKTGEPCKNILVKIVRDNNTFSWANINTNPVFLTDASIPDAVVISLEDVTEKKIAEAALQERERELSTLMDNLPGIAYRCKNDEYWTMLFISQGCIDITGYKPEELLGNSKISYASLIHSEDRGRIWQEIQTAIKESRPFVLEYRIYDVSGVEHWIWERGSVITGTNENAILEGFISDITKQKYLEITLRNNEERLRTIVQNMPVLLNAFDESGNIIAWNRECERVSGYSADEIINNPSFRHLLYPEPGKFEEVVKLFSKHKKPFFGIEQEFTCKDGSKRIVSWSNISNDFPIQNWHDWSIGTDVTRLKRIEKELREEKQSLEHHVAERTVELQKALQTKDDFLATMSHELRTPLTAILGMSEILETELRGPLNETQKNYVSNIYKSGQHLLNLINDILDMSKIEANSFKLEIEDTDIQQICESSLMFIAESASRKSLEVSFENRDHSERMRADPRRLKQILINLLNNAVKFTPEGGKLGLRVEEQSNTIHFTVWDSGIGIHPEDQKRIFRPFVQIDSSLSRSYEGTGLGLALVARLTELHGGSINLFSRPGKGSKITVSLPKGTINHSPIAARPHTAPLSKLPRTDQFSKKRILLAEDNQQTVETLLAYLETRKFQTLVARDGADAIQLAEKEIPDLILMDIQMPEINGLQAIRHLRNTPATKNIPIIAISALAMAGDQEKCLEAGADYYLSKPIRFKALENLLISLLTTSMSADEKTQH